MTHWTEEMFLEDPETFAVTMRRRVDESSEETAQMLALLADHGHEPETALDVACGIGRHAVELAKQGIDVSGIDISPAYIDSARERAANATVSQRASFEVADMRALGEREDTYDLVTNMWTAFGYFDEETNESVAEGIYDCVDPRGVFVMELANKEALMADYHESSARQTDDLLYAERNEYTPETGRMATTLTIFRTEESPDQEGEPQWSQIGEMSWDTRLYSPAELRRLLERAGFSSVSLYGGVDGSDLLIDDHRLVVVAEP